MRKIYLTILVTIIAIIGFFLIKGNTKKRILSLRKSLEKEIAEIEKENEENKKAGKDDSDWINKIK